MITNAIRPISLEGHVEDVELVTARNLERQATIGAQPHPAALGTLLRLIAGGAVLIRRTPYDFEFRVGIRAVDDHRLPGIDQQFGLHGRQLADRETNPL